MKRRVVFTELFLILLLFLISMIINNRTFIFDTQTYWDLGGSFWHPYFSIQNYPESIRGYFFTLILGLCSHFGLFMGNEYFLYRLLFSVVYVVGLTIIIPKLFDVKIGTKKWIIGSFGIVILFVIFWYQLLLFPLSDMFAFVLYAGALLCLKIMYRHKRISVKSCVSCLGAGALGYAAYNTRTVYEIPFLISIILLVVVIVIKKNWTMLGPMVLIAFGVLLIGMPQMQINKHLYGKSSVKVITEGYAEGNLFVSQLYWGIGIPRYETYIGTGEYPSPSVRYTNQTGNHIVQENYVSSIADYIKCIVKYPLEAMGIYYEHLISGLTLFRNQVYLTSIKVNVPIYIINCLIFIVFVISMLNSGGKWLTSKIIIFLCIVFPALIAIPGAIETRFFLPIYVFVYIYLCYIANYVTVLRKIKKVWLKVLISTLVIFTMWNFTSVQLLGEMECMNYDFHGSGIITEEVAQ